MLLVVPVGCPSLAILPPLKSPRQLQRLAEGAVNSSLNMTPEDWQPHHTRLLESFQQHSTGASSGTSPQQWRRLYASPVPVHRPQKLYASPVPSVNMHASIEPDTTLPTCPTGFCASCQQKLQPKPTSTLQTCVSAVLPAGGAGSMRLACHLNHHSYTPVVWSLQLDSCVSLHRLRRPLLLILPVHIRSECGYGGAHDVASGHYSHQPTLRIHHTDAVSTLLHDHVGCGLHRCVWGDLERFVHRLQQAAQSRGSSLPLESSTQECPVLVPLVPTQFRLPEALTSKAPTSTLGLQSRAYKLGFGNQNVRIATWRCCNVRTSCTVLPSAELSFDLNCLKFDHIILRSPPNSLMQVSTGGK
jgi:hypothetical protein